MKNLFSALTILFWMFLSLFTISCKSSLQSDVPFVKLRVLYNSCAGTIVQFVDPSSTIGEDWRWHKNLKGPFDNLNPGETYPRCVSAFGIPDNRQNVGDTISVTYDQLSNPPGLICAIGGMPRVFIKIKQLK